MRGQGVECGCMKRPVDGAEYWHCIRARPHVNRSRTSESLYGGLHCHLSLQHPDSHVFQV